MEAQLKTRTQQFGLRVIKVVEALPRTLIGMKIADQLLRAGTSVGANYRAACRARSRADFISKLGIVEEEADESAFWLEMITDAGLMKKKRLDGLHQEAEELTKIMVASRKSAFINSSIKNQKSKIKNP